MKVIFSGSAEEISKLLRTIDVNKDQLPTTGPDFISVPVRLDGETISYKQIQFRKDSFKDSIIQENEDTVVLLDPKTKKPSLRIESGKGITFYPVN